MWAKTGPIRGDKKQENHKEKRNRGGRPKPGAAMEENQNNKNNRGPPGNGEKDRDDGGPKERQQKTETGDRGGTGNTEDTSKLLTHAYY